MGLFEWKVIDCWYCNPCRKTGRHLFFLFFLSRLQQRRRRARVKQDHIMGSEREVELLPPLNNKSEKEPHLLFVHDCIQKAQAQLVLEETETQPRLSLCNTPPHHFPSSTPAHSSHSIYDLIFVSSTSNDSPQASHLGWFDWGGCLWLTCQLWAWSGWRWHRGGWGMGAGSRFGYEANTGMPPRAGAQFSQLCESEWGNYCTQHKFVLPPK